MHFLIGQSLHRALSSVTQVLELISYVIDKGHCKSLLVSPVRHHLIIQFSTGTLSVSAKFSTFRFLKYDEMMCDFSFKMKWSYSIELKKLLQYILMFLGDHLLLIAKWVKNEIVKVWENLYEFSTIRQGNLLLRGKLT